MKIVLFGGNGQLGWEFERSLPALGDVISLVRADLDLSNPDAIQEFLNQSKPNLIVNASAYTDVDRAESEPDLVMKINALAPGVMAEVSRQLKAVLIHFSTDYVYDGRTNRPYTETDPTNPLNVYGKSKLMGEENIKQASDAYLIVRTSWVYSLRGNSFVNKVLGWARRTSTLKIVNDQFGNPTWARMLAEIMSLVLAQNKENLYDRFHEQCGLYHVAGSGYTSRYDWAQQILANDPHRSEQTVQTVEPGSSKDFSTPAIRPLFSALDCSQFENTFGLRLPPWRSTLKLAMAG
jgi:dTDP-4-dehydrorhamnose reductase